MGRVTLVSNWTFKNGHGPFKVEMTRNYFPHLLHVTPSIELRQASLLAVACGGEASGGGTRWCRVVLGGAWEEAGGLINEILTGTH